MVMITQENIPYTADEIKAMVKTIEELRKKYNGALERAKKLQETCDSTAVVGWCEYIFPELQDEDERIKREILELVSISGNGNQFEEIKDWLEKQGKKPQGKSALEVWKDMRLEVYQQASGNRHEPNYSDDRTKMFSLEDIDEIIEKLNEQKLL